MKQLLKELEPFDWGTGDKLEQRFREKRNGHHKASEGD